MPNNPVPVYTSWPQLMADLALDPTPEVPDLE